MLNPTKYLVNLIAVASVYNRDKPLLINPLEFAFQHTLEEIYDFCAERLEIDAWYLKNMNNPAICLDAKESLDHILNIKVLCKSFPKEILVNPKVWTALRLRTVVAEIQNSVNYGTIPLWNTQDQFGFIQYLSQEELNELVNNRHVSNLTDLVSIWVFLDTVKVPTSCLEYWDIRRNLEENLKAIGFSGKSLLAALINRSRQVYGTARCLDELLSMKRISNIIPGEKIIRLLKAGTINNPTYYIAEKLTSLGRIWEALIEPFLPDDCYLAAPRNEDWILHLYLLNFKQWRDSGSDIKVGDHTLYIHHHTVVEEFAQTQYNRTTGRYPIKVDSKLFPHAIDQHPKKFFASFMQTIAKKRLATLNTRYGDKNFPELPKPFLGLSSKWKFITKPIELITEGDVMHHCVGGDSYIEEAFDGDLFFHYDDGTRHGLTVELNCLQYEEGDCRCTFGLHVDSNSRVAYAYRMGQIKGLHNRDPDEQVEETILRELMSCNDFSGFTEEEVKRIKWELKYAAHRQGYTYLSDITCLKYSPIIEYPHTGTGIVESPSIQRKRFQTYLTTLEEISEVAPSDIVAICEGEITRLKETFPEAYKEWKGEESSGPTFTYTETYSRETTEVMNSWMEGLAQSLTDTTDALLSPPTTHDITHLYPSTVGLITDGHVGSELRGNVAPNDWVPDADFEKFRIERKALMLQRNSIYGSHPYQRGLGLGLGGDLDGDTTGFTPISVGNASTIHSLLKPLEMNSALRYRDLFSVASSRDTAIYDFQVAYTLTTSVLILDEKVPFLSKVFNRMLARRMIYGFESAETINRMTKRLAEYHAAVFSPMILLGSMIAAHEAHNVKTYSCLQNHCVTSYANKVGAAIIDLNYIVDNCSGVDYNDPLTRDFLGYHGSIRPKVN